MQSRVTLNLPSYCLPSALIHNYESLTQRCMCLAMINTHVYMFIHIYVNYSVYPLIHTNKGLNMIVIEFASVQKKSWASDSPGTWQKQETNVLKEEVSPSSFHRNHTTSSLFIVTNMKTVPRAWCQSQETKVGDNFKVTQWNPLTVLENQGFLIPKGDTLGLLLHLWRNPLRHLFEESRPLSTFLEEMT